jgi:hypothetical protein
MHGKLGWWHVEILQVEILPYKPAHNKDSPPHLQVRYSNVTHIRDKQRNPISQRLKFQVLQVLPLGGYAAVILYFVFLIMYLIYIQFFN